MTGMFSHKECVAEEEIKGLKNKRMMMMMMIVIFTVINLMKSKEEGRLGQDT